LHSAAKSAQIDTSRKFAQSVDRTLELLSAVLRRAEVSPRNSPILERIITLCFLPWEPSIARC